MKQYRKNYRQQKREIEQYYQFLVNRTENHQFIGIINEWIVDNYYMIVEQEKCTEEFFHSRKCYYYAFEKIDLYKIIAQFFEQSHCRLDFNRIIQYMNEIQTARKSHLCYETIASIPQVCFLVILENLNTLIHKEAKTFLIHQETDHILEQIESQKQQYTFIPLETMISQELLHNSIFLERFYSALREKGQEAAETLNFFLSLLQKENINLEDVFQKYYDDLAQDSILIANIFYTIRQVSKMKHERLYSGISATEKVLLKDKIYRQMTTESKEYYRSLVVKNAKKMKKSQFDYISSLSFLAQKNNRHIGFYLYPHHHIKQRNIVYLSTIFIITTILSLLFAPLLFKPFWISFLFLMIPMSEIVIQLSNKILLKIFPPHPLPKIDFSEGIPKESSSMVVITTILKDAKKVESLFRTLETYYLANNSENLYFTLLGDATSYSQEHYPDDEKIVKMGKQCCDKLNQKYGNSIFHFVYRKRKYNAGENCYLGWERKRGALQDFNQLLLHKLSKQQVTDYFHVTTIPNDLDIRYIIPLDTDTQLPLGTAIKMVGAMAHPLNHPILNDKKNKVIAGYGIMQPKITVDIHQKNQSYYSQIYAGLGGFDVYSSVIPNLYQDVFEESSFTGKGIYNLAVFDQVLSNRFPTNLILSHDLLEGNYIRCGFLSDVELLDDFPTDFLVDSTRKHRWARGDMQIIPWAFNQEPLNSLHRFKIIDNIRRGLLPFSLLCILFLAYTISPVVPYFWVIFIGFVILLPIIFFLLERLKIQKERSTKTKQYQNIFVGFQAAFIQMMATFSSIPYHAKLYLDAFIRSIYRMTISKKNLLNWVTAEEASKTTKKDLYHYLLQFKGNYIVSILLIVIIYFINPIHLTSAFIISLIFLISPTLYYLMGKSNKHETKLSKKEQAELYHLARLTWNYFQNYLTAENHFLIPDNYQYNREEQIDHKTSPTNIGFSLLAVISAHNLGFITQQKSIFLITKIINTVDSLEKWHGHLYNWYHIETKEVMAPFYISTVDSGNLVAALITTAQYVGDLKETTLQKKILQLINQTDFSKLYKKDQAVLAIGYNTSDEQLAPFNYDKFASESRLTSYIAIAKGDIPSKHWFCLDKSLTKFHQYKGLLSWSGTSFEYFMPLLFMKDYPNTLMDESYHFAYYCQKEYGKIIDSSLPWGISEAAYNVLDDSKNYKYQAFGTPYLRFQVKPNERIVLAPYASLLALPKQPKNVYQNYRKYQKIDMVGEYGCYESYDVEDKQPVLAYFAHHQGMILASITNYLCHNKIQQYFYQDVRIEAFDILNKEKMQIKPMIDTKINQYKTYDYQKEVVENDVRVYRQLQQWPEISVLSNTKYTVLLNDRGNSFSRYNTIQLNRYRKVTTQDYGMYLYIKDKDTDDIWSNTYAPTNIKPNHYEVTFALDRVKYTRLDHQISTTTEIIVTKEHNAEIRKITFKNLDDKARTLEITSYSEPILCHNNDDVAHRVFNSMFMKSSYDKDTNSLIFSRKIRNTNDYYYMIHNLWIPKLHTTFSYETDRNHFLNRNDSYQNPTGLYRKLSNYTGDLLDPISTIRSEIKIPPLSSITCYMTTGFGTSKQQVLDIIEHYQAPLAMDEAFSMVTVTTDKMMKQLGVTSKDTNLYNQALNDLYQTTQMHLSLERRHYLLNNTLSQKNLWRFGISGDYPIILIEIEDLSSLGLIKEVLKMYEYYKNRGIYTDLVIINSQQPEQSEMIAEAIQNELYCFYSFNDPTLAGKISVIDAKDISIEERNLLKAIARLKIHASYNSSLKDYIENRKIHNQPLKLKEPSTFPSMKYTHPTLEFYNGYGGFQDNGKQYYITTPNTPMPWCNILANPQFGCVITNNCNGFTYAYNSKEYKITNWTNDTMVNDPSEGIIFNHQKIVWENCVHGFGYSTFYAKNEQVSLEYTVFVPQNHNVKCSILTIENLQLDSEPTITYWMHPVLGETADKTVRHIVDSFEEKDNTLLLQNRYTNQFKDSIVYLSSSEKIKNTINEPFFKAITIHKVIPKHQKVSVAFFLGCEECPELIHEKIHTIQSLGMVQQLYLETKQYWEKELSVLQVNSPDLDFNYMVNGWYLYQTIASRIYARSGFYQVGGAYGFRDQLQDCINIVMVHPTFARNQILNCASHQFQQGDVLHWWHENSHFGLRSRFKDDYLWLVYAVSEYLMVTQDFAILKEPVPFVQGDELKGYEEERGMEFFYGESTTLENHLIITIQKAMQELGDNGLPLMGGGDWNDGMNHIGIHGKGTSVWLAFFLYDVMNRFITMIPHFDTIISDKVYKTFTKNLKKNIEKNTWDGKYFLRAFHDNGNKIGSTSSREGKIDLISQSFAILTDIAKPKQIASVLKEVDYHLVDTDMGFIKLLTPPFTGKWLDIGYIQNYPKGIRENGGQYTHACAWYIMALEHIGKQDQAYQYYQMLNPIYHSNTHNKAKNYQVEPYVIPADIYSHPKFYGKGGWTWYTGSSGWFYNVAITNILGFHKLGNTLLLTPSIPHHWKNCDIVYQYLDTTYHIAIRRGMEDSIKLDHKAVENPISLQNDQLEHHILIVVKEEK